MKLQFKKIHTNASIPKQASEFAGGWDVTVTEIIQKEEDLVICKLGFALGIPKGHKLTLVPRSSLTKTRWILQNSPGLGDADFKGEYQFRFRALPSGIEIDSTTGIPFLQYPEFPYQVGDRVGQVYLEEVIPIEFEEVEELESSVRGNGGFGSTGN